MANQEEVVINRVLGEIAAGLRLIPGFDAATAQDCTKSMAQKAFEKSCQRSNDIYSEGNGESYLSRETTDANLHTAFEKRRRAGATDDDIRWWWDLSLFEQEMLLLSDDIARMSLFSYLTEHKGWTGAAAAIKVWKVHPKFGDPDEGSGDDRPLPTELKRRITAWIFGQSPETLQGKVDGATSLNALIRREMSQGTL